MVDPRAFPQTHKRSTTGPHGEEASGRVRGIGAKQGAGGEAEVVFADELFEFRAFSAQKGWLGPGSLARSWPGRTIETTRASGWRPFVRVIN